MQCDNKEIINQFNRSHGQVASIGKMIEAGRSCSEIMQQIVAARASMTKLGLLLLEAEAKGCIGNISNDPEKRVQELERAVAELFKIS